MVSFISTRELSKQPGRVLRQVKTEGPQVITQNGTPAAYLIPASRQGIEADLDAVSCSAVPSTPPRVKPLALEPQNSPRPK